MGDFLREFGMTLSNSLADAILHTRDVATPAPVESRSSEPKANPPAEFDGTNRRKLDVFIAENEIVFATAPRRYRDESMKVLAASSYLKGDPKKWFNQFFMLPEGQRPTWIHSWAEFCEVLRKHWGTEDPENDAEIEIRRYKMKDSERAISFTARFRTTIYRLPSWSDRNLRNQYYAAIAPRLRAQLVTAGQVPPTGLEDLIRVVEANDRAYWANQDLAKSPLLEKESSSKPSADSSTKSKKRKHDSSKNNSSGNSKARSSSSNNNNKNDKSSSSSNKKKDDAYKKYLGPDGKLLPEERERRIANNLCLLCGGKNHNAEACPKRRKTSTPSSSTLARATVTITPAASSKTDEAPSK